MIGARFFAGFAFVAALLAAPRAQADPIVWVTWGPAFVSGPVGGATSGTLGAVSVSYSGELENLLLGYPSYAPAGTFSGGTIDNVPSPNEIIQLFGNTGAVNTVTFSSPVTNPVMAIWSLGQTGQQASFQFLPTEPFAIQSGGPSAEYAGSTITALGDAVFGVEGNGTIQFFGTFSSLTWTNPEFENWYGFTFGAPAEQTPEPASVALAAMLALMLFFFSWSRQRVAATRRSLSA